MYPVILDAMRETGRVDRRSSSPRRPTPPAALRRRRPRGLSAMAAQNRCQRPGSGSVPSAMRTRGLRSGKTVSLKDRVGVGRRLADVHLARDGGLLPDFDATLVSRVLEDVGMVNGMHGMNGCMGDVRRRSTHATPGTSTAVIVRLGGRAAAGEVDISFGGDQGGWIRLPAAFCGAVGLKPTFGLISHFAIGFAAEPSVDHVGPMARAVPDVAAALAGGGRIRRQRSAPAPRHSGKH